MNGSFADTAFIEGDNEDGGEGIHVNNGQSSPDTASRAEFYEEIQVLGGDAPSGVGGNALHGEWFLSLIQCYDMTIPRGILSISRIISLAHQSLFSCI